MIIQPDEKTLTLGFINMFQKNELSFLCYTFKLRVVKIFSHITI